MNLILRMQLLNQSLHHIRILLIKLKRHRIRF